MGEIKRASRESRRKSELAQANWKQKWRRALADGAPLTSTCPAWLRPVDGAFEPIPEAAAAVAQVFKLRLEGLGKTRIARTMNSNGGWRPPSGGWKESYIHQLLRDRHVLGEHQPKTAAPAAEDDDRKGQRVPVGEPILDYYPHNL